MTENELIIILNTALTKLITNYYSEPVIFVNQYQSTQKDLPKGQLVWLNISQTKRYGFPQYREYNNDNGERIRETIRELISTVRVTAAILGNVKKAKNDKKKNTLTSHDLVEIIAEVMESPEFQQEIIHHNVYLERIAEIITLPDKSDNTNDELRSHFDVCIHYKNIRKFVIPTINKFETKIKRV